MRKKNELQQFIINHLYTERHENPACTAFLETSVELLSQELMGIFGNERPPPSSLPRPSSISPPLGLEVEPIPLLAQLKSLLIDLNLLVVDNLISSTSALLINVDGEVAELGQFIEHPACELPVTAAATLPVLI